MVNIYTDGSYSTVLNSEDRYLIEVFASSDYVGNFKYISNVIQTADFSLPADHDFCSLCGNGICDASETCLGCSVDCNGEIADCEEGYICDMTDCVVDQFVCIDRDGDGYGKGSACLGPDCDDRDSTINPSVADRCNRIDDNCDGVIDEDCNFEDNFIDERRFSPVYDFFISIFDFLF